MYVLSYKIFAVIGNLVCIWQTSIKIIELYIAFPTISPYLSFWIYMLFNYVMYCICVSLFNYVFFLKITHSSACTIWLTLPSIHTVVMDYLITSKTNVFKILIVLLYAVSWHICYICLTFELVSLAQNHIFSIDIWQFSKNLFY